MHKRRQKMVAAVWRRKVEMRGTREISWTSVDIAATSSFSFLSLFIIIVHFYGLSIK